MTPTWELLLTWALFFLWLLLGAFLGYAVGWHRGVLRMPFFPTRTRSRRTSSRRTAEGNAPSPSSTTAGAAPSDDALEAAIDDQSAAIRTRLADQYPGAHPDHLDAMTDEIVAKGKQIFAPSRAGARPV